MLLKSLTLKNFRTHTNATFEFSEGVTAIIGGNGSGKSSIVEAIIFLLTGEGYGKTKSRHSSITLTHDDIIAVDAKNGVFKYKSKDQNNIIDITITKNISTSSNFTWTNLV